LMISPRVGANAFDFSPLLLEMAEEKNKLKLLI